MQSSGYLRAGRGHVSAVLTATLAVLVALLGVLGPAGLASAAGVAARETASTAGRSGSETRVGAIEVADADRVGAAAGIGAGQRLGEGPAQPGNAVATGAAANAGVRSFGNFAAADLRAAAQAADRNGLTQVGRALQKHSGRDGSVFNGLSTGSATARNEQGLGVLDEIFGDPNARTEVLDRVTNIWDSTGRGVRYGNDGSFMGFLEPVG